MANEPRDIVEEAQELLNAADRYSRTGYAFKMLRLLTDECGRLREQAAQARRVVLKEAITIAESEMVDADSTGDETDYAYNRAIFDVVESIQMAATVDSNTQRGGNTHAD